MRIGKQYWRRNLGGHHTCAMSACIMPRLDCSPFCRDCHEGWVDERDRIYPTGVSLVVQALREREMSLRYELSLTHDPSDVLELSSELRSFHLTLLGIHGALATQEVHRERRARERSAWEGAEEERVANSATPPWLQSAESTDLIPESIRERGEELAREQRRRQSARLLGSARRGQTQDEFEKEQLARLLAKYGLPEVPKDRKSTRLNS